ncbi:vitamin K epoxide reductase family protein [Bifidobacterium olomucense]|uniref:Vitamin K epoxide reductase family protein n=1 Tax=Bifidobacterium olomucense TaxID=2675324 RepID=A0A7Y0EYA5_9BIFI|nr:vitamin K epoxide reductase family protein [Bifidobacterium sp. DSM 109959]NMM98646.1 Vitamin K epoxide reductase family protein [Bifidobacterium sp. DSM 109959]
MTNSNASVTQPSAHMSAIPTLKGWRHSSTWTYLVMLIASAVALGVSFILSAETLQLARHPEQSLGCDVNAVVSCSTVAQSWQAEIIKFGGLSYPNAFFGIAAESVFVTIAVIGLAKIRVPRWFATCTWLGGLAALTYAYWLSTQSLFVIHALCPWCLALMFSTTVQFMALSHATVAVQGLPSRRSRNGNNGNADETPSEVPSGLVKYYRLNIDLMIDVLWIVAIVVLIITTEGAALFA